MKDVGLRIRLQRELREEFLDACSEQDKPAAQVLREFMREYVQKTKALKPKVSSAVGTNEDVKKTRKAAK